MRRVPAWRSTTSPAALSTFRCCDTAGRGTRSSPARAAAAGSSPASAPTDDGPSPSRSKIARRVGSPRAASALVIAYRKLELTLTNVKLLAMSSDAPARLRDMTTEDRSRWIALYVLCAGVLMIVLDVTIVNVALPSIQDDLGFSASSLAWVVNAYLIAFGGLLLLAGRLGDLISRRTAFLGGLLMFTAAS